MVWIGKLKYGTNNCSKNDIKIEFLKYIISWSNGRLWHIPFTEMNKNGLLG